jgi:hypothetical protein
MTEGRRPRTIYREEIPWKVRADDMYDYTVKMLRAYGAMRAGRDLPPVKRRQLEQFMRRLDEVNEVVDYDPTAPDGERFHLVPRQKGDTGYTRKPR